MSSNRRLPLQLSQVRVTLDIKSAVETSAFTELKAAIQSYQQKEQGYSERLEATEIARATAARGEAHGKYCPVVENLRLKRP